MISILLAAGLLGVAPVPAAPTPAPTPVPAASSEPSKPGQIVYTALGDSITAGAYGSTYTLPLAASLNARLTNLGIGGEFSGEIHYQLSCKACAHLDYGGILKDEVPKIPLDTTLITLYVGTNDMWVVGDQPGNVLENYEAAARAYDANIRAILAAVRARVPDAKIVLATVPNRANRPNGHTWSMVERQGTTNFANAIKRTLVATGYPIADLMCDPAMYDDTNFGGPTDPHPNAKGFAAIAADFLKAIRTAEPVGHCKYETLDPS